MKTLSIVISFLLAQNSFATGPEINDNLGAFTGTQLLMSLAPECSIENFAQLHQTFQKRGLLAKETAPQNLTKIKNGAKSADGKITVTSVTGTFEMTVHGKPYSGNDVCDLLNKLADPKKENAFFRNLLLPTAHAQNIVNETRASNEVVAGAATTALGALMTIGPLGLTTVPGLAVGAVGVNMMRVGWRRSEARKKVQSIINSKFQLFCSDDTITLQSNKAKLIVSVGEYGSKKATYIWTKNGKTSNIKFSDTPETATFLEGLAKECKTPQDATRLTEKFNSKNFRTNVALLVAQNDSSPIRKAERLGGAQ